MADDYSRALARTAVGQLAELAGYEAVQDSSADILSELMIKYITELSSTAHGYAELACRTGINLHDMLWALDDLGTSVPELQAYLSSLKPEDNTFAHVLTDYPIRKPGRALPTWNDKQEAPPAHIPNFLPAFPDKHTYQATPTYPGHEMIPDKQAKALQRTRKQAESAVLKLHQAQAAAAKASQAAAKSSAAKSGTQAAHSFLEPPTVSVVHMARDSGGGNGPGDMVGVSTVQGSETVQQQGGGAGMDAQPHSVQGQPQQVGMHDGRQATAGPAVAQVAQGTGVYEPDAAVRAFAPVLQAAEGAQGDGGDAADGDGTDLMAPEELMWRWRQRQDQHGVLKCPLGTASDYTSTAFAAARTYTVGKVEEDAFEEAAKETMQANAGRKRASKYAILDKDPNRKKALQVLEDAKKGKADPEDAQP